MAKIFAASVLALFAIMTSLVIMFMTGCGREETKNLRSVFFDIPTPPESYIDPYFKPLIDEYKADMAACGLGVGSFSEIARIEFAKPKSKTNLLGVCWVADLDDGSRYRRIVIRDDIKDTDILKPVFYHEMTHCVYSAGHDKVPGSIMFPTLDTDSGYWDLTWTEQVAQLCDMIKAIR